MVVVGAIGGSKEALAQAQDLGPQLILIGLDRPGLETISRLRKVMPGVGIIALSLLEGNAYRQAVIAAGADDLVPKADLTTDLLPAIRRVMQGNRSGESWLMQSASVAEVRQPLSLTIGIWEKRCGANWSSCRARRSVCSAKWLCTVVRILARRVA